MQHYYTPSPSSGGKEFPGSDSDRSPATDLIYLLIGRHERVNYCYYSIGRGELIGCDFGARGRIPAEIEQQAEETAATGSLINELIN